MQKAVLILLILVAAAASVWVLREDLGLVEVQEKPPEEAEEEAPEEAPEEAEEEVSEEAPAEVSEEVSEEAPADVPEEAPEEAAAEADALPDQIVVQMMSERVERGQPARGVTQVFAGYRLRDGACIWEDF